MSPTSKFFVSCLFCLALSLVNGCGKQVDGVALVEKPIKDGAFEITRSNGEGTETLSLVMYVSIRTQEQSKFDRRYEECKTELIDRITTVMYALTSAELIEEPEMIIFKEKAKRAINDVLGTPFVQQVFVGEVSYEVQ